MKIGALAELGAQLSEVSPSRSDPHHIRRGQLVIMPFGYSDGTCPICHEGINTACPNGGFFGQQRYYSSTMTADYDGPVGWNWYTQQAPLER